MSSNLEHPAEVSARRGAKNSPKIENPNSEPIEMFKIDAIIFWKQIKTYVNSGDWVSNQSWVLIEDGVVRLKSEIIY